MAVTSLARFNGGSREALIANGRRAKAIHEKAGAELFRVGQIYTGPHAGQWMVSVDTGQRQRISTVMVRCRKKRVAVG